MKKSNYSTRTISCFDGENTLKSNLRKQCLYRTVFLSILWAYCLVASHKSFAHGDLDEEILAVSEEIKITPDSAFLYFKRGKLHFQHEEYKNAIIDLEVSNTLGYDDTYCDLVFAKSYQRIEQYEKALEYLSKIEEKNARNVIALKTKAEIFFSKEQYEASATYFEKVIKYSRKTLPENYLATSKCWESLKTSKGNTKALEILQKGINDLGPLFIFYDAKRELYLRNHNYQEALAVQQKIISAAKRKEMPYYKAAQICLLLNQKEEARKYLKLSLKHLNQLPQHRRNVAAMLTLKQDAEGLLESN